MRLLKRMIAYARIARGARRNRTDLSRWLVRRPMLLGAVSGYELAVLVSNRTHPRLKYLAALKASSLVGCPF